MKVNIVSLQRAFLFGMIVFSFSGSLFLSWEIGAIHIFPFRIFLILQWLLFVGYIFYIKKGYLQLTHIKVKQYLLFFAIWLGYAFISTVWAADKTAAVKNVIFLFTGVSIIFFIVYYLRDIKHLKSLFWLWIAIFLALLPVGLWEVVTGNHLIVSKLSGEENALISFAPTATFVNQNDFAACIALTIPLLVVWIRYYSKLYSRILSIFVLVVALYLLIMTLSRACYIAVAVGFSFWFLFLLQLKRKIKTLVMVAVIGILIFMVLPDVLQGIFRLAESEIKSLALFDDDLGSNVIRQNLIKNAVYFTVQSVGFGVGAGNVEYYMENHPIYPVAHIINVHNWWAEILVNYGIFIFAGYVLMYGFLFLNLWRAYKKTYIRNEKMICEALLFGLVSFFMASISSSSIIAFTPQWIYVGIILAFLNCIKITKALN